MPARPHQVMVILGTRPEAIKVAPVVRLLSQCPDFETTVVSTGQHREMLEQMWDVLDIRPDHELAVMRDRQSLSSLTGRLVDGLGELIRAERPEVVLVQGDTTTAMPPSTSRSPSGTSRPGCARAGSTTPSPRS
jgi:UDP-N-acetylglucosamine 2-epimerase (non-hydrolysing)